MHEDDHEEPRRERRRTTSDEVLFRSTIAEILAIAEALPDSPTQNDIDPIVRLARSALQELRDNPALGHTLRDLLTITTLSRDLAGPGEMVAWIKEVVRASLSGARPRTRQTKYRHE